MDFLLKEGSLFPIHPKNPEKFGFKGLGFGLFPYRLAVFPFKDKGGGSAFYLVPRQGHITAFIPYS
jgi:hypothetical protein